MEEAKKADTNKPPIGLISRTALEQEALVMQFGAQKYDAHNWRNGMKYSRLLNAALRHILAFNEGEDLDPETGLSHLAHARCCLAFLMDYQASGTGQDDRYVRQTRDPIRKQRQR